MAGQIPLERPILATQIQGASLTLGANVVQSVALGELEAANYLAAALLNLAAALGELGIDEEYATAPLEPVVQSVIEHVQRRAGAPWS